MLGRSCRSCSDGPRLLRNLSNDSPDHCVPHGVATGVLFRNGRPTHLLVAGGGEASGKVAHMSASPRRSWIRVAVLLGIGYALVGILFALPRTHVQAWRWAAWIVSAIGYAAHIAHERFRLQNSPRPAALHIAFAVAIGAFGLSVGANIHSLATESSNQHRQLLFLSLGIWPLMTAVPAFLVALGASAVLAHALGRMPPASRPK